MVRTIFKKLVQKNLNIEKITFKVVQIKFLAMHINNKKYVYDRKCTKYLHDPNIKWFLA